ncbi:hypothetical protein [Palleronia sp.]|uniref:hypothetical protein n=1 Tax=Palleronia sp. TaxID=1940284 RepID=UPI0035C81B5F
MTGDFPTRACQRLTERIVSGDYMRNGDTSLGKIDRDRSPEWAPFLFASGFLKDAQSHTRERASDVSSW